jgi:type II secretory pathway pseudopilin PulG
MKNEGFTLIELIIYIAIVSLILILSSNFAWDIIQGNVKSNSSREVQQNARFAMERVSRSLREGNDPLIFSVVDGVLYESDAPLTSEQVRVVDFSITSVSNTYKISLTVEYNNISGRREYEAESTLESTIALFSGDISPPPEGCWGTGGECDLLCHYANYGIPTAAYREPIPPCNRECNPARNIFIDPSGACSDDGTGDCYKMADSTTGPTECIQRESCEGRCEGICTPCREIVDPQECEQQEGCRMIATPGGFMCHGECIACEEFPDEENCSNQLGCGWNATAWYWELASPQSGYFNYVTCEWYEE